MSESTGISWCDSTFNPWMGCTKVSPACDNCYAEALMDKRWGKVQWGSGMPRVRTSPSNWKTPLQWERNSDRFMATYGRRRRVFCASLSDVFDNEVDPQWRVDLFALIAATPKLDWLLLTKRIGNVKSMLGDYRTVPLLPNIWLGATVVNQEEASRDIPKLLAVPARVRFLSIEPMLGPVDLVPYIHCDVGSAADWVICGGESGSQARPMNPDWVRSLRDQCAAAGVPFHFKQWGEWIDADQPGVDLLGTEQTPMEQRGARYSVRLGVKAAGRHLDGFEHNGFPQC